MRSAFTEKLILIENTQRDEHRLLRFNSFLREDFIKHALHIAINKDNIVEYFYFSSNDYGNVEWSNGYGIRNAHQWASEDDLENLSKLE